MNILFNKSLLLVTSLFLSMSAFAIPVIDGHMDTGEYSNSFVAGWYNGHNQGGSQYQKGGDHTTTVYWEQTNDNFFLYIEAPIAAKNMIWGTGFTEAQALEYYEHWCSPNDGNPAALDGSNCAHHSDGFNKFKTDKVDFGSMTGSEKLLFGEGLVKIDKHGNEVYDGKNLDGVLADLDGNASGNFYGDILEYQDSVDFVINDRASCDTTNCDAADVAMAFELKFGAFDQVMIDKLILDIQTNELEFHLSPEWGAGNTIVPEPSIIALLSFGLLMLGATGRSKRV